MKRPETVRFDDLDLATIDGGDPDGRWLAAFPFSPDRPGGTTAEATDFTVVYNELDPGKRIGRHTDDAAELLFVLDGTVEATVSEETITVSAGSLSVLPAGTDHQVRNVGSETAELVGVFGTAPLESTFETEPSVVDTAGDGD